MARAPPSVPPTTSSLAIETTVASVQTGPTGTGGLALTARQAEVTPAENG